jgi:hypothetical protein
VKLDLLDLPEKYPGDVRLILQLTIHADATLLAVFAILGCLAPKVNSARSKAFRFDYDYFIRDI